MEKKKRDDLTLDYESDFTYAQKLNRGKKSRVGLSAQNLAARVLAIVLTVMCALFLIVPLTAYTIYSDEIIVVATFFDVSHNSLLKN